MWYSIISDQLTYSHIQYNYHINSCQVYEPYWYVIHLDHGYGYDKDQTFSSERLATLQGDPRDPRTTDGWVFNQMSFDSWSLRTPIVIFWMVFGWNLQGFFGCILELELAFLVVFGWFLGAFCPSLKPHEAQLRWHRSPTLQVAGRCILQIFMKYDFRICHLRFSSFSLLSNLAWMGIQMGFRGGQSFVVCTIADWVMLIFSKLTCYCHCSVASPGGQQLPHPLPPLPFGGQEPARNSGREWEMLLSEATKTTPLMA